MTDDSGRYPRSHADDADDRPAEGESTEPDQAEQPDGTAKSSGGVTAHEAGEPAEGVEEPAQENGVSPDEAGPEAEESLAETATEDGESPVPPDVRKYERFKKVDDAEYERVNEFLRDRTYVTAREWAIARLCADFRTETGVEMTKIGENLPELVPFMTDTYSPQAVNQARASFEEKVRIAGATFLYGAMCDFFTPEELDEVMYEVTEVAKFLLEVEGVDVAVEEELEAEDRISGVMREVRQASEALRYETCPNCGHDLRE